MSVTEDNSVSKYISKVWKVPVPWNSTESVAEELQAAQIELPGATMLGFMKSASSKALSSGSGPLAE